jgi:hypothetical protein
MTTASSFSSQPWQPNMLEFAAGIQHCTDFVVKYMLCVVDRPRLEAFKKRLTRKT